MGLKIVTDDRPVKIIRKDKVSAAGNAYTQYSAMVASKDKDGNWHNGFIDVAFKSGISVDNKAQIAIKNAFPVVSEYNGKTSVKWMITDFDVIVHGEGSVAPTNARNGNGIATDADGFLQINADIDLEELPFA